MLSRTAEYALRATLLLARNADGDSMSTEDIALALGAPRNYLGKILNTLVRRGMLHSARGPHGGFTLAVSSDQLSVADIVGLFTEPKAPASRCLMGNRHCNPDDPCVAHERWIELTQRARVPLMRTTISELMRAPETTLSDAQVADHTGAIAVKVGRNPIQTGTKS